MPVSSRRPTFSGPRRRERGISLIEALVALAVMAFGTLAVLGVQQTLRFNADVSKQRSEALRIAQQRIEDVRAFDTLADAADPLQDFDALDDAAAEEVTGETGETTYTVTREVDLSPVAGEDPDAAGPRARYKNVRITVDWTDRIGTAQSVVLETLVHGALPALSGSLAIPANLSQLRTPLGRHAGIPLSAVDQGDGTSVFTPPGAPDGVRWTFNNVTGVITRLCATCTPVNAQLLTGFVRYALTAAQPTGIDAESPPSPAALVAVQVAQTVPAAVPAPACYSELSSAFVTYYCAVQTTTGVWSGRSTLVPSASLVLATDGGAGTDWSIDRRRVCRYTPVAGCDPTVGSRIWGFSGDTKTCTEPSPQTSPPTPGRPMTNADHPDTYANVTGPLLNQNFLVIAAGSGGAAFTCPGDDSSTPFVNGNTRRHQP